MRIAIYHPSLNLFGGGEAVGLTIAEILSEKHDVTIFSAFDVEKSRLEEFFGLDLNRVNVRVIGQALKKIPSLNSAKPSMLLRSAYKKLEEYDLVIDTRTNGWFDKKLKTKTMAYVHFPYFEPSKKGMKKIMNNFLIKPKNAFQYDKILCNSEFTKKALRNLTEKSVEVVYPPVSISKIKKTRKENIIVTVGRFTSEKKQEIMIESFKKLYKEEKSYEFHLIGSFQENTSLYEKSYLDMLKKISEGYPIKFHINMSHKNVLNFLAKSKIYWHARGYGELDPNEYENFGITTVEAMAYGCVPVAINLGAQPEIVNHGFNGYCWGTKEELVDFTMNIIKNKNLEKKLRQWAIKTAKKYDSKIFEKKILKIVHSLI